MAITKRNKLNRKLAEKITHYTSLGLSRREIARRVGVNESTLRSWGMDKVKSLLSEAVEEETNRFDLEGKSLKSKVEPIYIHTNSANPYESNHFVIPDTQYKPGVSSEYLRCVGEYIVNRKPDVIIHLGDHADIPSLSSYDKGKKRAEGKRLINDIEASIEGMNVLLGPLKKLQDEQLKEFGKVLYKPRMVLTLGNHECLKPGTEVLTSDGFVKIEDMDDDYEVLTMNGDDEGEWHKPNLVYSKDYEGDLYNYNSRSFSVSCTPKHRMYYKTSAGKTKVKEARDMNSNFSIISALDDKGAGILLTYDELKLAAWMCTDSHFTKGNQVVLYQRLSNSHKIANLLDSLGVEYSRKDRDRDIKSICGKDLKSPPEVGVEFYIGTEQAVIENLSVYSNKELPEWVRHLSSSQWDTFLETLIEADGSIPTKAVNSRVFYGAKRMCDSVQCAAVSKGWSASVTEYREGHFRVNLCKRSVRRQESMTPSLEGYSGKVWCLDIPNSNFMIRYNGKVHLTGNCRIMRHVEANPELSGFLSYDNLKYKEMGWEVHDFLKPVIINGVSYCHYMPNPMSGKPMAGMAHSLLQKIGESHTCGHKQTLEVATRFLPASGRQQWSITAGACYDHFEDYKGYQGNHHWRGVVIKHNVMEGSYNPMFVDLGYLMKRYAK